MFLSEHERQMMVEAVKTLLPCPCCGAAATVVRVQAGYSARCTQEFCGMRTKNCHELEAAVGIWNARVGVFAGEDGE